MWVEASALWARFPNANEGALWARLDASKYLAPGLYRRISSTSGSYVYVHAAEIPEFANDETLQRIYEEYIDRTEAPLSEVGAGLSINSLSNATKFPQRGFATPSNYSKYCVMGLKNIF